MKISTSGLWGGELVEMNAECRDDPFRDCDRTDSRAGRGRTDEEFAHVELDIPLPNADGPGREIKRRRAAPPYPALHRPAGRACGLGAGPGRRRPGPE
ncbi:hypothetical protein, partial [Nonomuraea sp. NPDC049784]|uniref:hypothetical protein n=1 Tax=Nonomuraea sp. NPDC049784 TaxID=3154361 RepID=UPI00341032DA